MTFKPSANLIPGTTYTANFAFGTKESDNDNDEEHDGDDDDDDVDDARIASSYLWSFTTAADGNSTGGTGNDIAPPTVIAVVPANNATSVPASSKFTATFSEAMNSSTITTSTITLKQGTTSIAGSVAYSGNVATFTPSTALTGSTTYIATVTTAVKDAAGNVLAANYTWSFTTAAPVVTDVTPPTVLSVVPALNAASVAANSKITATFSESMNSASITTSTITLKQGTTSIAGSVAYSGNVATFTPSTALSGGTKFTATVTTGVKDVAGNALGTTYTWSFTKVSAGLSFAANVMPVLNLCNTCHTHPWTTSSNASAYYTNLANGGYVKPADYTTSKIYAKLNSGHPGGNTVSAAQINNIITWMKEGSKNN